MGEITRACDFCRFAHHYNSESSIVQCRRRSPDPKEYWPDVKLADWCGEFEPFTDWRPGEAHAER